MKYILAGEEGGREYMVCRLLQEFHSVSRNKVPVKVFIALGYVWLLR